MWLLAAPALPPSIVCHVRGMQNKDTLHVTSVPTWELGTWPREEASCLSCQPLTSSTLRTPKQTYLP